MEARHYSNLTRRFTSADSVNGSISAPQTLNLYAYVMNNPMVFIDPTGHSAIHSGDDPPSKGDDLPSKGKWNPTNRQWGMPAVYKQNPVGSATAPPSINEYMNVNASKDNIKSSRHGFWGKIWGGIKSAGNFLLGVQDNVNSMTTFGALGINLNKLIRDQVGFAGAEDTGAYKGGWWTAFGASFLIPGAGAGQGGVRVALGLGNNPTKFFQFAKRTNSITYFDVFGERAAFIPENFNALAGRANQIHFSLEEFNFTQYVRFAKKFAVEGEGKGGINLVDNSTNYELYQVLSSYFSKTTLHW